MIEISCKFYLQKNDVTYCINIVEVIIRHQKLLQTCRELPTVALSHHMKIRELWTSGGVFGVNRYECFMENKNITFCRCKLSKNNFKPDQNFTCYKEHGGSGLTSRLKEYQKQKKGKWAVAKNYQNNLMLNLQTMFIWDKKKHTITSEMSWCNILWRAGLGYYVNDFPGTFANFYFKKFTQEIISSYADILKIFNSKASF